MRISDWSSDVCSSDLQGQVYLISCFFQPSAWAMGRPGRSEASGLRFDRRLEGIVTQCSLLLQVEADFGELFRWHSLVEDVAPGFPAFGLAAGEALPDRVRSEERRGGKECGSSG